MQNSTTYPSLHLSSIEYIEGVRIVNQKFQISLIFMSGGSLPVNIVRIIKGVLIVRVVTIVKRRTVTKPVF